MQANQEAPFGHTLLIDKPLEWTSFDAVNKLRYAAKRMTGRKKIKVGHAGTLDPLATGLLIICVGSHTKRINELTGLSKTYSGTILLGATTPSLDRETDVDETFSLPDNDPNLLKQTADKFTGSMDQMPPIYSAKKIDGQKAYELARKGEDVQLNPSRIFIESFEVDGSNFPEISFYLKCSKGTYVRSIARDYGKALNSGAYLTSLRRTEIGEFQVENALSIDEGIANLESAFQKHLNSIS